MHRKLSKLVLVLVALVLTLPLSARDRAVAAGRQGPAISSIVSGNVTSVSGTTITLANGAVVIDASSAVIATPSGPGSIISVTQGSKVTATVNADAALNAPLRASHIIVVEEPDLALSGPVQSIDRANRSFVVLGRTVFVTDATSFAGRNGTTAQLLDTLTVNSPVAVTANVTGGRLIARTVYGAPALPFIPAIETFEGVVQSIQTDRWVIAREGSNSTVTVKVTSSTAILGNPRTGDRVRVITATDDAGARTAITIAGYDVPVVPSPQNLRWIHGRVLGTSATSWTIQENDKMIETSVVINANTKIAVGLGTASRVDILAEVRDNQLIALVITPSLLR